MLHSVVPFQILTENGYNLPKVTQCTQLLQEYVYGGIDIDAKQLKIYQT